MRILLKLMVLAAIILSWKLFIQPHVSHWWQYVLAIAVVSLVVAGSYAVIDRECK